MKEKKETMMIIIGALKRENITYKSTRRYLDSLHRKSYPFT